MRPRLVFLACLVAVVAFGLLMVYSASSVTAMKESGDPTYFLVRQAVFAVLGAGFVAALASRRFPWDLLRTDAIWWLWGVCLVLLIVVALMGAGSRGAVRWISIGNVFTLQPSEFLKPVMILLVSKLLSDYYETESIDTQTFLAKMAIGVVVPLIFIFFQPDLGTTIIIGFTVFMLMVLAGISKSVVGGVIVVAAVAIAIAIAIAPYRMERLLMAGDPWSDPYGDGYQATLAIMAFASGGLFGRGIGGSTMKYFYLPEAHNDYILAIIGEELGFFGTLAFFAVFAAMVYAAFAIAKHSPSRYGAFVAEGCATIIMAQFLVNALGILGLIPMTGKTMPFISYDGSSLIASLILAGLILRVSIESNTSAPYEARRARFAVMSEEDAISDHLGRSTAGEPRVRTGRGSGSRTDGFSVYDGAGGRSTSASGGTRRSPFAARGERRGNDGGYGRVDLHGDPADRLRDRGPRVRDGRRGSSTSRRDRYDR